MALLIKKQLVVSSIATLSFLTCFLFPVLVSAATMPQLPELINVPAYSLPVGGTRWQPTTAVELQAAFDGAQPGDVIELQAGMTYTGNFKIKQGSGGENGWIYVISSNANQLPGEGVRVSPANVTNMAKIMSPNGYNPTLIIQPDVHNFRLVGVEIATAYTERTYQQYGLVRVGWVEPASGEAPAENIIFDRCYIHGTSTGNIRDGFVIYNVSRLSIINSYISDIHGVQIESHGIQMFESAGPVKISNNHIEAAGINVFIGDDVSVEGLIPRDVEVTGNHLYKPLSWKIGDPAYAGIRWLVKNLFEIKDANRVLVANNILENNWADAQNGTSILFTPIGGDVTDVTFKRNILKGSDHAMIINPTAQKPRYMNRVLVEDNIFYAFAKATSSTMGISIASTPGHLTDVIIRHNTVEVYSPGGIYASTMFLYGSDTDPDQIDDIEVKDNIFIGRWGIGGTSKSHGYTSASYYCDTYLFQSNVLVGEQLTWYADRIPADEGWKDWYTHSYANISDVGLTNNDFLDVSHFKLKSTSNYYQAGTDGKDIGADIDAIIVATANVVDGGGNPPPSPTTYTIQSSAGANGSISPSGATTVSSDASQSFTITANTGYQVQDVLVDGVSVGALSNYTFSNITTNHTISVSFTAVSPPACTSFTYSAWSDCQSNSTQSRTVSTSLPAGCTGGNPTLSQSCAYTSPVSSTTCTYFTYSAWADCQSNSTQSRTVSTSLPAGCTGGNPTLSQSCAYTPADSSTPSTSSTSPDSSTTCTSFTYSAWGTCQSNSTQSRTVSTSSPSGCTGGSPILSQSCAYTPATSPNQNEPLYLQLNGSLYFGKISPEVTTLQKMLSKDAEIYPSQKTSGVFGRLTETAVQKFQCKYLSMCSGSYKTNGYGAVGPRTVTKLNEIYGSSSAAQNMSQSAKEILIAQLKAQIAELLRQVIILLQEQIKSKGGTI
jgi:hypothetical protein